MPAPELPTMSFPSDADFRAWLEEHHATSPGIWLKIAKKGSGVESVGKQESLDTAICFGWIDGQVQKCDDKHWLQRYTPRTARSKWSKINTEKAERLIASGAMAPAGLAEVEKAKADGRWEAAYAGQRTATVPDDLQAALDASPSAAAFFATLTSQNRYAITYRIQDAKRPETRARRIAKFVAMLEAGETLH